MKVKRQILVLFLTMLVEIPILPAQSKKEQKKQKEQVQKNDTPARKPRWKATDRPVAKKTQKKAAAKKKANKKKG